MFIMVRPKSNCELSDISKVIHLYRYITLIVISVFFLINDSHSIGRRIIIVTCIGVACLLMDYLYVRCISSKQKVLVLLLVETIFNAYILIPSGGLSSPYIWYSLNTILVAAIALDRLLYCWINLFVYLFSSIWVLSVWFTSQNKLLQVLEKDANFILSLVLITGIVQVLTIYSKHIQENNAYLQSVNEKVVNGNRRIKESMNYIMELYQAVHLLTSQKDEINLEILLLDYAKKMTNSKTTFLIKDKFIYRVSQSTDLKLIQSDIDNNIYESIRNSCNDSPYEVCTYQGKEYILVPVKCHYKVHAIIGVEFSCLHLDDKDIFDQLKFLSELGTIVLEKFELERVNRRLLINEEQNRIANEIHDGVLQNLFSVSCGINSLVKRCSILSKNNVSAELSLLRTSVNSTMSDLRSTVYGYSWNKNGENNFISDIHHYIDMAEKYHGVRIEFVLEGSHDLLSTNQKKTIYRIISEATSNSIKHGKAKSIMICLKIRKHDISFSISDNGSGFDVTSLDQENKMGLGLRNLYFLTHSLEGNIQVDSEPGKGTSIGICFPKEQRSVYVEEVI